MNTICRVGSIGDGNEAGSGVTLGCSPWVCSSLCQNGPQVWLGPEEPAQRFRGLKKNFLRSCDQNTNRGDLIGSRFGKWLKVEDYIMLRVTPGPYWEPLQSISLSPHSQSESSE